MTIYLCFGHRMEDLHTNSIGSIIFTKRFTVFNHNQADDCHAQYRLVDQAVAVYLVMCAKVLTLTDGEIVVRESLAAINTYL